jgi:sugar phosphate isomerase/epimerase/phosphopantetheinyl transferase
MSPTVTDDDVHVTYCLTDRLDERAVAAFIDLLSADEHERRDRFVFPRDAREFAVAHGLLRRSLSAVDGRPPHDWAFSPGAHGKPRLAAATASGARLSFNLAHTDGLVACAIARDGDVGIDVEAIDRRAEPLRVAHRYFADVEVAALTACEASARHVRFIEIWTLKEAYVKAIGAGLACPLDEFAFGFDGPGSLRFERRHTGDAGAWHFSLYVPSERHRIAVAVAGDRPVVVRDWLTGEVAGSAARTGCVPAMAAERRRASREFPNASSVGQKVHMSDRGMRCLATVSMGGSLREKLEATAAAHFDAVELFERDMLDSHETPRSAGRLAGDLGLRIEVFGPLRDVDGIADDGARQTWSRAERLMDAAVEAGAGIVLVCSNTSAAAIDDPARSATQLARLGDAAAARGLRIGFEALSWGTHIRTYRGAWTVVRRAAHASVGLVLDTFHTSALDDDPAPIEQIPGDRIFLVQVADAPLAGCDLLYWSRHLRCFPGEGALPVVPMLRHVMRTGYRGPLSVEVFSDAVRQSAALPSAQRAMTSLLEVERTLGSEIIGAEGSFAAV